MDNEIYIFNDEWTLHLRICTPKFWDPVEFNRAELDSLIQQLNDIKTYID